MERANRMTNLGDLLYTFRADAALTSLLRVDGGFSHQSKPECQPSSSIGLLFGVPMMSLGANCTGKGSRTFVGRERSPRISAELIRDQVERRVEQVKKTYQYIHILGDIAFRVCLDDLLDGRAWI